MGNCPGGELSEWVAVLCPRGESSWRVGNCPGGSYPVVNCPGGSYPVGNCPVGSCPDTINHTYTNYIDILYNNHEILNRCF